MVCKDRDADDDVDVEEDAVDDEAVQLRRDGMMAASQSIGRRVASVLISFLSRPRRSTHPSSMRAAWWTTLSMLNET